MVSVIRISVLSWADLFAEFTMYVMMNYLTDVWNLSTIHAAAIINIWDGITKILPILFAYLLDVFMSDYYMLVVASLSYSIGLAFLSMSTPPLLGPCSKYQEECIGHTQKVLLFTALALIAVGKAGQGISLGTFTKMQLISVATDHGQAQYKVDRHVIVFFIVAFLRIAIGMAIPFIQLAWSPRFYISSICTLIATLLFFSGCQVYKRSKPAEENIISPSPRVDQVEDTPYIGIIRMLPMSLTFIVIGIVLSIGNTYFLEQANQMDHKLGRITISTEIFFIIYTFLKARAKRNFNTLRDAMIESKKFASAIGVARAVYMCAFCCTVAALVETRRLHVIRDHGLLDNPNGRIPMSIFWLLPQFILLGNTEGIANGAISCFFNQETPKSLKKYSEYLAEGVLGLGTMASVLSIHIAGKVSARNQKPSWFQPTLNESRFDRYYWMLAALSAVNLFVFLVMSCSYKYKDPRNVDEGIPVTEVQPVIEDELQIKHTGE